MSDTRNELLDRLRIASGALQGPEGRDVALEVAGWLSQSAQSDEEQKKFGELASQLLEASADLSNFELQAAALSLEINRLAESLANPPAPELAVWAQDPELLHDFLLESNEHLAGIESQVLCLEQNPGDSEAVNSIFRSFHSIKGLAGFLELQDVREVAHEVETALDQVRQGTLKITPAFVDIILAGADFLRAAIKPLSDTSLKPPDAASRRAFINRVKTLGTAQPEVSAEPDAAAETAQDANVAAAPNAEAAGEQGEAKQGNAQADVRLIKVDTSKLDMLVDLVGEMVIAQAMVRHDPDLAGVRAPRLIRNLSQLARTTGEVQKVAMAMRMVPIGALFRKMSRVTRDLGRKSGKKVQMELAGEDTELDRNLVEELADPLLHMVRNAVDHGLEPPDVRVANGKSPQGTVRLTAAHKAGRIVIELSDDGRGLDRRKIVAKARERGILSGEPSTDAEVFQLIFHAGFSTAEKITDVSGRGVGMDVVRKQIQKLRGKVDIESKPGQGTLFRIQLPLTLAIIDGLVVGVGEERYIVPLFAVQEVMRPTPGLISTVEGRAEVALVRDRLIPVVRLYERFGIEPRSQDPCDGVLVLAEAGPITYALMVDELVGKQEVVIKSLGGQVKNVPGVAGGAILGDGRVGLVLDVHAVFAGGGQAQ